MKTRVLFIVPYPSGKAPSQRFRVEQLLPLLDKNNISYDIAPFINIRTWNILYTGGSVVQKIWGIGTGFLRRWKTVLLDVHKYDIVFIHREAAPVGPPVFEWIIERLWKKKVIYDFDDAIWVPIISDENKLGAWAKAFWKIGRICKWATVVAAGNEYLCEYARENKARDVVFIPTVVDTEEKYKPQPTPAANPVLTVGWTGSHSTLRYLAPIKPVIRELKKKYNFSFLVIADKAPEMEGIEFDFIEWSKTTEIEDLARLDIGVMPLTHDKWSEGKCGFKLIQYMSLGIPAVASPVGVNKVIIKDGVNGFLADNEQEWIKNLSILIENEQLRRQMGAIGIKNIEDRFSIRSVRERFLGLFNVKQ